jgi:hypothetical protein
MGLEEVTSFFHLGLAESARQNPISARGFSTCLRLDARKPLVVNYIMGVASIPAGFDRVVSIQALPGNKAIALRSASGKRTETQVDLGFVLDRSRKSMNSVNSIVENHSSQTAAGPIF